MMVSMLLRLGMVLAGLLAGFWLLAAGHWGAGLAVHFVFVGGVLWGTLRPNSSLFGPVLSEVEEGWQLTIDDGPDPVTTPRLLDLLDKGGMKATFFLIGQKAEAHPELVREIVRRGHEVGNHTWSHPQASFWVAGPWRTQREIVRCQEALTEITGKSPSVFRAPVGHSNLFVHPMLRILGLDLIGWSCRGYDAVAKDAELVLARMEADLKPGAIVLTHEATPIAEEVVAGVLDRMASKMNS